MFQPEETKDDEEFHKDFWSIQGLHVPREESIPIPLKYIDVIRSTHTELDEAQGERIDDYWNVDGNRNLSDSWTGFTRFTLLNETLPKAYMWSWRRLTKIQTTSRPDHIWPDAWTKIGKAAQRREKQKWTIGKPKLEYARDLRGIYSIDPSDEEYKDIIKNVRRKLETPKAAAMPCKRAFSKACIQETVVSKTKKPRNQKQRLDSVVLLKHMNPQDKEYSMKNTLLGRENSVLHYNSVHTFIPMLQAMKIQDAKAAVDKEWKTCGKIPAWGVRNVKRKRRS